MPGKSAGFLLCSPETATRRLGVFAAAVTGVVWFDAHGQATTPETTTSGFLDGMGISILTGQCWKRLAGFISGFVPVPGDRIALVGARDMEPDEVNLLKHVRVSHVPINEGFLGAVKEIARKTTGLYVH